MERSFWVACPGCRGRFYCVYSLRHANVKLECPFCYEAFSADDSPDIDERWYPEVQDAGESGAVERRATPNR